MTRTIGAIPTTVLSLLLVSAFLAGLVQCSVEDRSVESDTLQLVNSTDDGEVGVLVDGKEGGSDRNDKRFVGPAGQDLSIGNFSASDKYPGRVIAFTTHRPPTVWLPRSNDGAINWTDDIDPPVRIPFEEEYAIDVHVWIVTGDVEQQRRRALDAELTTAEIWEQEGQGIRFSSFSIHDVIKEAKELGVPENFSDCAEARQLEAVGFMEHAINVYYMHQVGSGRNLDSANGEACPNGTYYVIALGDASPDHLLAHELGHAFLSSGHTDCLSTWPDRDCSPVAVPLFDRTNVMHSASDIIVRASLTEGQTFRAIANPGSAINSLYNARPDLFLVSKYCGNTLETDNAECPPVQKRVWPDLKEDGVSKWDPD